MAGRLHGIVVIDKPAGWTSHDVVARMRRLLSERRVGHAGTLDPAATGVLPVAVGDATKVLEYLSDASKTYLAEFTFGIETDSHDLDGRLLRMAPTDRLSEATVRTALHAFEGQIDQIPPMHSAVKVGGRRLYELARAGVEVERAARRVHIFELRLLDWRPPVATVLIDCSKGTYVRALARDVGAAVGPGAYLSNLVRLRTGPFTLCDAWTMTELAMRDVEAEWPSIALHADEALIDRPALVLDGPTSRVWQNGGWLRLAGQDEGAVRVYGPDGDWLGVGRYEPAAESWRPLKVVGAPA